MSTWVVEVTECDGEFAVGCPDLPEVITSGRTFAEAVAYAEDAIVVALGGRVKDGMPIPTPRPAGPGDVVVFVAA